MYCKQMTQKFYLLKHYYLGRCVQSKRVISGSPVEITQNGNGLLAFIEKSPGFGLCHDEIWDVAVQPVSNQTRLVQIFPQKTLQIFPFVWLGRSDRKPIPFMYESLKKSRIYIWFATKTFMNMKKVVRSPANLLYMQASIIRNEHTQNKFHGSKV